MYIMEHTQNYNDAACRLCDENAGIMYSIFEKNDDGQQILHLIKDCLPIVVYRTDPLSKQICEKCLNTLTTLDKFKKTSLDTAKKHREHLRKNNDNTNNKSIQLFLDCEESKNLSVIPNNVSTSTDDLTIICKNCKSTILDPSLINNEIELCAELHKAIADSLSQNKLITQTDPNKSMRSTRRRRSQAFYHELDDSLCSSLTEFTNTESSQCYEEYHSDMESYDSENDLINRAKRRRLDTGTDDSSKDKIIDDLLIIKKSSSNISNLKELFANDEEIRYFPLSLMQLTLNVINKGIVPDIKPNEFYTKIIQPQCNYCNQFFKNSKLLAIHEVGHINIELGEKVDNPIPWHESRDDSDIRNKWLNNFDDNEDMYYDECADDTLADNLLIPVGTSAPIEYKGDEIKLILTKPVVNGIPLSDYPKDERKAFYQSMRIGGVNKKFCTLCRYSFKDNWAIESHYFSSACYYTCRYCGMRFNKQRNRFDEHVKEHEDKGDAISIKIYAASKLNNVVPKIIQPDKVKQIITQHEQQQPQHLQQQQTQQQQQQQQQQQLKVVQPLKMKNLMQRRSLQTNLTIKEEPRSSTPVTVTSGLGGGEEMLQPPQQKQILSSSLKSTNQAYFCRKCYKVFFKLDEFNVHSKNCDYNNQFPPIQLPHGGGKSNKNGEIIYSSTGRPMRNCVREISTYKDDAFLPDLKETNTQNQQQNFLCCICNTPFPTIYSRNSHMRIHKGEITATTSQRLKQNLNYSSNSTKIPSYSNYINDASATTTTIAASAAAATTNNIKQEPLEPEIQIHEEIEQNFPTSNIGAVSITPISKNPNQKATINPNIMKLVQSNPHLTIKPQIDETSPTSSSNNDPDRSYKCSSCWEAFANKSHLYFHKKNQCEGSKYPCPFCKKRFGTESAYSSHIFYSHPE